MNPQYAERLIADVADTSTILPAVFAAIATGKYEEAGSFMTDEVILDIKGHGRMNGSLEGRDAVVEAMRLQCGMVHDQRPAVDATIHAGYTSAVLLTEEGIYVDDGTAYSIRVVLWVTYHNGFIHRLDKICAAA